MHNVLNIMITSCEVNSHGLAPAATKFASVIFFTVDVFPTIVTIMYEWPFMSLAR